MDKLKTFIPSLDDILHGGVPKYSVTVVAGGPGSGKTVLTLQTMFGNAADGAKCLYLTTLSEPATKLIRYTQMYNFFNEELVDSRFKFLDIGTVLRSDGPQAALEYVTELVEAEQPDIVAIDSFKAIHDLAPNIEAARLFTYDLAVQLSMWSVTTFLVGEYTLDEISHSPEFAIADAIVYLSYERQELQSVREIEILKLRGSSFNGGRHFLEISSEGAHIYPRVGTVEEDEKVESFARIPSGVPGLDEMLEGGLPELSATIIEGGTGIGKTLLGMHFLAQGTKMGTNGIIFTFEERPSQLKSIAAAFGINIGEGSGIDVVFTNPIELTAAKWLANAREMVASRGVKRVMIDSLSTMSLAMSSERRFRELVYSIVKMFRSMGVTLIMTMEAPALLSSAVLTGAGISSICDNIIVMRYVEVESQLRRAISILKMRGTSHASDLREFKITPEGIKLLEPFKHYRGVLSGLPTPTS